MRRFGAHATLVVAAVAAGLLLLEGLLRLWNPFQPRLRANRIVLPINTIYSLRTPTGALGVDPLVIHRRNSLGFRGPEPPRDWGRHLSIVTVGGSTTECFYLSEGRTWPDRLAALLSEALRPLWLNNAGLDGHSTYGHLVLLQDHVARIGPKVVLLLAGLNDVGLGADRPFDRRQMTAASLPRSLRELGYAVANKSELVNLLVSAYRSYRAQDLGLGHQFGILRLDTPHREQVAADRRQRYLARRSGEALEGYRRRLERIVGVARERGIELILVTQPALYGPGHDDRTGLDLALIPVGSVNGAIAWEALELYNDVTRAVARERDLLLVDLAHRLPKSSRLFYDHHHFTNDGAEAAATILASELCPHLQTRYPSDAAGPCLAAGS